MLLSYALLADFEVRAGLTLPALNVLDAGDRAPDGVVEEGDRRRLVRIRRDARDERVQMVVAAGAKVQRPEHLMAAQTRLFKEDHERLLDLTDRRLFAGAPGQHEVLDGSSGAGAPSAVAMISATCAARNSAIRLSWPWASTSPRSASSVLRSM